MTKNAKMSLNKAQKRAVEYLEGPLLVLAGPGTGKTQLLSEKVAYILENTDVGPENILCVTFTESGAANMRERLKTIIGKDALSVNISTYHVLGQEILGAYRAYSENYERQLDDVIDEVRQFKIVRDLQAELPGTDILRGDNVKDIISVIGEAKAAGLSAADLLTVAEQNMADSKVISEAISPLLLNVVPRKFKESYERAYQPIYEILKDYGEMSPILPTVERSIAGLSRDLKAAILAAEEAESVKPLTKWRDDYFERDENGDYRLKDRVANLKLKSLASIMEKYENYLSENGLYDFDDMIEEAVKVLKRDDGFRLTLSERYQFIMLDEFQDTNPSQLAIIKELTDYEKPLIMAVGDDDQAIYEFQGAMSTNLTEFQRHYEAEVIALTENYRSTQEILDFSHRVIEQAPDRFADKELLAHKPNPTPSQIVRREFWSSDAEYGWIADEISRLIRGGVSQSQIAIISYKTKYFMPLLPFLKAKPEIKIAYEKRDNLFENEQIHEILTIARFVYELANERKVDTSLIEILSYPFFELSMLEVVKLAGEARRSHLSLFEVISGNRGANRGEESASLSSDNRGDESAQKSSDNGGRASKELAEVAEWLADLAGKSFNEPLELFLDYLIGATGLNGRKSKFLEYYTKDGGYEAFSLYENLAALRGKLRKHFGEKALRLKDLIEMVDDYEVAEMPLNTTSPYRDADEAVAILTAHKAKGMEFEYVFMISADHTAWGKGKGNNNLLSLPKNLAQIRHTGTTDGEKLRVLYVTLTRAKSHLYITNSLHDFNGKDPARLEYFEEVQDGEEVISPFLPDKKVTLDYAEGKPASVEALKNWLKPFAIYNPDMRAIYLERVKNYRMNATALTGFIDVVYSGPVEFFKNTILLAPREPETEALAYGNLVHATFEAVTKEKLDDGKAIEFFMTELERQDLPIEMLAKLRDKGPVYLEKALKEFGAIIRNGKAEVNFAADKLTVEGVPITGKVDHIVVDEEAKTIEIYDFKTAGYHKEKWQSHPTLYKYMLQLGFYKLLINNSPIYRNYKVEKAHILFVTPDKDGLVYDKVYEYTEADEKALISLLKAVYAQISTLEFMDDPEIFVGPDENKKLKDIFEFVSLLESKN